MIRHKTGTGIAIVFLLATAPWTGWAETPDAVADYAVSDPATGKAGTAHATITAVISENMVIEFVTPMNLTLSGKPGDSGTLRLATAGRANRQAGGKRDAPPPSVAVQGLPNQTFAVSIGQTGRNAKGPDGLTIATFTHNAGKTPHIGPAGDTEFLIGATLRLARDTIRRGYSGTLDLIVSHN